MEGIEKNIDELEGRINRLVRTQIGFQTEITALREELARLRKNAVASETQATNTVPDPVRPAAPVREPQITPQPYRPPMRTASERPPNFGAPYSSPTANPVPPPSDPVSDFFAKHTESARADLEKFIGENLISKIGILVLIIGVGIGVKYSIDNNLISPLTRVVLAYIFAFGIIGVAIKLKSKYHNFSAALISGGMAILYFVTYFAYSAYSLISQPATFGLMVLFTVLTVAAALF
ncbi:MAG: DUF2339 domain-containing protein, partial [Acidobacteria bacterium]|nr:DUF2339 domain-containing protein [Acidobacteriota bacterium]